MAKENRGSVVSVRISEEEQNKLRTIARERGTTVSALVRMAALGEANNPPQVVTETTGTRRREAAQGVTWSAPAGSEVVGNTITITVGAGRPT